MPTSDVVHVAIIYPNGKGKEYLYLKNGEDGYFWEGTDCRGNTVVEAISNGVKKWKIDHFRLLNCGFLYTVTERDEHGMNATFEEMRQSYQSSSGQFFHQGLGHMCFVQGSSDEALKILRSQNK
jgi:hypothetical protein